MKKPHKDHPSTVTKETNVEFFTRMIEYSPCGPLMQLFMTQALMSYTEHVLENKAELTEKMKNGWINPESWIVCAEELKKELDKRLSPPSRQG